MRLLLRTLLLCSVIVTTIPLGARAQSSLGVYFDLDATQSVANPPRLTIDNYFYVIAQGTNDILGYEFGLVIDPSIIILGSEVEPPGAFNLVPAPTNFIVGGFPCMPGAGNVLLVTFQYGIFDTHPTGLGLEVVPSSPASLNPPVPAWLDCSEEIRSFVDLHDALIYGCVVTPNVLDFGAVPADSSVIESFTITNLNPVPLEGSVEESCSYYDVTSGEGAYVLDPGDSLVVVVEFSAPVAGTHECSIGTGPECGFVACTAEVTRCAITPDFLDFGEVPADSSVIRSFTITNVGASLLQGSVDEDCFHYNIVAGGGSYTLAAGNSLVVDVEFSASFSGIYNCDIATGLGCNSVPCTANIVGEGSLGIYFDLEATQSMGYPPPFTTNNHFYAIAQGTNDVYGYEFGLVIDPSIIIFGSVVEPPGAINLGPAPTNFIVGTGLCLPGTDNLLLVTFQYGVFVPDPADLRIEVVPATPSSFRPPQPGWLDCRDNLRPFWVLQDAVVLPTPSGCVVTPDSLDFGIIAADSVVVKSLTITNTGIEPLQGNVEENCPHYSILSGEGAYLLGLGDSRVVDVEFVASSAGTYECAISTGPECSAVSCTAEVFVSPFCAVTPDSLDFGLIPADSSVIRSFTITNPGAVPFQGNVEEHCPQYDILSGAGAYSLDPGDSLVVEVEFSARFGGTFPCEIGTGLECSAVVCMANVLGHESLGIYFDLEATQSIGTPVRLTTDNYFYAIAQNVENLLAYEFGLVIDPHITVLSTAMEPPGSTNTGTAPTNFIVGTDDCVVGAGPLLLVTFQYGVFDHQATDLSIELVPASPSSMVPPSPAWLDCDDGPHAFTRLHNAVVLPLQSVVFVDAAATGDDDGTSWDSAFLDLQDGLLSASGSPTVSEIWVAAGTYEPTGGTDQTATFQLLSGVGLYGGFEGTETDRGQRDWVANETIVSGEIGDPGTVSDNSDHVVTGSGTDSTARLDGFTVTAGNGFAGAGMINDSGSPTISNVTFADNFSSLDGGGLANYGDSSPTLTNTLFARNRGLVRGGGIYDEAGRPVLEHVVFQDNQSALGGGMHSLGSPSLTSVIFSGNVADEGGGGMHGSGTFRNVTFSDNETLSGRGGGLNTWGDATLVNVVFVGNRVTGLLIPSEGGGGMSSSGTPMLANVVFSNNSCSGIQGGGGLLQIGGGPTLLNVTFSNNRATDGEGGAMYNLDATPTLVNTIFWDDFAEGEGHEIHNENSIPMVSYSLVAGSGGSGPGWDASLGADGGHNLDEDPLFIDGPGDNLRLSSVASPAYNAGSNAAVSTQTDLDGNPRIEGGIVDMGAYEYAAGVSAVALRLQGSSTPSGVRLEWEVPAALDIQSLTVFRGKSGATLEPRITLGHSDASPRGQWLDTEAQAGVRYRYRVSGQMGAVRIDSEEIELVSEGSGVPQRTRLLAAAPNPFNPSTTLSFEIASRGHVRLSIYNAAGRLVTTLVDEVRDVGRYETVWEGRDVSGLPVASGVYLYQIQVGSFVETKRMVLLK